MVSCGPQYGWNHEATGGGKVAEGAKAAWSAGPLTGAISVDTLPLSRVVVTSLVVNVLVLV